MDSALCQPDILREVNAYVHGGALAEFLSKYLRQQPAAVLALEPRPLQLAWAVCVDVARDLQEVVHKPLEPDGERLFESLSEVLGHPLAFAFAPPAQRARRGHTVHLADRRDGLAILDVLEDLSGELLGVETGGGLHGLPFRGAWIAPI